MHVTVNSQVLARELRLLNKIVPSKPPIAILSHILLVAEKLGGEQLRFFATDLEVGLQASCEASVQAPGRVALPAGKLLSLVEQFPNGDVSISLKESHVAVAFGSFNSKLRALSAQDFPEFPVEEGDSIKVEAESLRWLIERTRPAVMTTTTKYMLQGALLTVAGPVAAMVATNGMSLALATSGRMDGNDNLRVTIPVKALDVLKTQDEVGLLEITAGQRALFFRANGRLLTSRVIEGKFPAYERIIPRENTQVATVDRAALTTALRRMLLVAETNKAVYFNFLSDKMELTAASAEVGSADEALPISYTGEAQKICLNGEHVLDFLTSATRGTISIALKDARSAVLFTDGDDFLTVVMPMRSERT